MPSSPTASLRLEKQADGENVNLWGDKLDQVLDKVDAAIAGWATIALTGSISLSTANYATDQAALAMLKFTGAGQFTVTVPAVSKAYRIWNACTAALTVTNGSSSTVLQAGEVVDVITDGGANFARVQPTDFGGLRITSVGAGVNAGDAVNFAQMNAAITAAAYSAGAFGVAIVPGNAGQFLTNNGSTPSWGYGSAVIASAGLATIAANTLTVLAATGADIRAATSATKANTPKSLSDSAAFVALTDAATVLSDVGTQGYNLKLTLTASGHTIAGPTWNGGTPYDGCPLLLAITPVTYTCSWATGAGGFDFAAAGTPTMSAAAGKTDFLSAVWSSDLGKWRVLGYNRSA